MPQLENKPLKVRELVQSYRDGKIVIPEFQRDYVWKPNRAPKLVDSMFRGYPISSLLLWDSAESVETRRNDPRPSRSGVLSWLIDGQQRLITLARILSGDEGIDVVFNPIDDGEFRLANAATKNDPENWFRVSQVLDNDQYRIIRRRIDGVRGSERKERALDQLRGILEYEVPVVRMVDHEFKDAVQAFERINTLGMKLKKEDIESAQVAAKHSGFIADEIAPFLATLRGKGFTRLNVMHLFRVCAFVAKPDGRNRTPLHELDRKDVDNAWKKAKKAIEAALDLVRSELGLLNMDILWSGALLVPIIALCATTSPRERDAKAMIAWLALAALSHRYSVSSETALDQDLRACRDGDPISKLLTNLRQQRNSLIASERDFAGTLLDRSGLLASYIACMNRGALDFHTGGKITLHANIDRHHILPRAQFPDSTRASSDVIANIAFITDEINKSVGAASPDVYLPKIKKKTLESQCIPQDPSLWSISQAEKFFSERRKLLAESFNEFVRAALPNRRL
jgi:hypothetical protein